MIGKKSETITEDEAALYDRQIRLWGLDAQKRLRSSRVLVAGACGLGAEVAKNLVLAGVKSLTLLDHRPVTKLDLIANFLVPEDCLTQNIAEASQERAQDLNPMVEVHADPDQLETKTDEYFRDFDVVCITNCTGEEAMRINNICRQHNILFYMGDVLGMFGFMFADLGDHEYVEEVKEKSETEDASGQKHIVEETKMVRRTESFVPMSQALQVDWTSNKYASRLRRTTESYFMMLTIFEFQSLHGRKPDASQRETDIAELLTIKNALMDRLSVPREKVGNQFASLVFGQLSPVCAIVGGVLAQEIIKAVSQKDQPHNNFFFFNTSDGSGVVDNIGM
ncbi:SUMO1 activating enzyme subunit 1 [Oratosquilla oratoria]|uniref:SUMO1 activating enzyme subunit 1 n=1 Tax=Oratosquilla oratoria TaxID=337810 RepID=UPI003F75C259